MEKALPPNNIQDNFLNAARRERSGVTIYLISGVKLTGRIKSFDKYSLILEAGSQEQLIFKHAISTVSLPRGMNRGPGRPPMGDREGSRQYGDRPQDASGSSHDRDPGPPPGDDPVSSVPSDEA